jgi:hypothetical protein
MRKLYVIVLALSLVTLWGCKKNLDQVTEQLEQSHQGNLKVLATLSEPFEIGTKTAYTTGSVTLSTGSWTFNDALIGNSTSDKKTGAQSARIRNSGRLTMNFDKPGGAGAVTVDYASFGTDAAGTWQLWYSTNSGVSYIQSGSSISSTASLQTATFNVNVSGNVRLEIRKTDGGTSRLNIDNVVITDFTTSNPAPVLSSLTPSVINAGSAAFTLSTVGNSFVNGSQITWNGTPLTTTFVSTTQLSASVAASLVSTAGVAQVAVVTPAPGGGTSANLTFTINPAPVVVTAKKFLFDAKHAQTAGNADWVIDQDASPQRIPTPTQTNITATTTETYWNGGISNWGVELAKQGHIVETLPTSGTVSYGNANNVQDLSRYDVFVVDEPNTRFTTAEKTAILRFVQNGGGLIMIGNHDGSDRNNDGWDSPRIWNDLMSTNTVQANPFGMTFNLVNIVEVTSNRANLPSNPILNGSQGVVNTIEYNNGSTMSINTAANSTVTGLFWRSGVSQNTTNIMCATATFGTGRVFAICDSSPTDDGTGAPGNILYDGWDAYNHRALLMNASVWAAKLQ